MTVIQDYHFIDRHQPNIGVQISLIELFSVRNMEIWPNFVFWTAEMITKTSDLSDLTYMEIDQNQIPLCVTANLNGSNC